MRGERGPQGDHGQDGRDGRQGEEGEVGHAWLTRKQALTLAILFLSALMLLAWRTEVNASRITETQYLNCVRGSQILDNFNKQNLELIRIESDNTLALPQVREARIAAYRSAISELPDCELQR